ncbi:hypothetical protein FIT82_05040 [Candidatus Methylopumilus universalis]|jgi:hypothetical protein|uniref:hypothetical protein n=1 Tax=Candidatus Methylopumilus universalis TaxID=2588536 RepID=UPI00111FDB8C|nr:hypothetical protein [Candidatus Methylopumilus universalis]QDC81817.1 hypothetical protein FIT82_05040 [Candidatus Methylopumilus universalis]
MSLQDIYNYIKNFLIEKYDAISNVVSNVLHWIWTVDLLDVSIVIFYLIIVAIVIYALIKGIEFFEDLYKKIKK